MREGLIQRDVRQRTGYWNTDLESIDPSTPDELAGAIDLVGGGSAAAFGRGAEALLTRGDLPLSLRIATLGLLKYSDDQRLQRVRAKALDRLREKNQINNPFKFIIYSELAGKELAPVHVPQ
jgi:hypothetical protein